LRPLQTAAVGAKSTDEMYRVARSHLCACIVVVSKLHVPTQEKERRERAHLTKGECRWCCSRAWPAGGACKDKCL